MMIAVPFAAALVAAALCAAAALSTTMALAALRGARGDRHAALEARRRHAQFADAAQRLAHAAAISVDAVREALVDATHTTSPAVDGVLFYEEHDASLLCTAAFGPRFAYYAGTTVAHDDPTALPARAIATGRRAGLEDGLRPAHPADVTALAIPLALGSEHRGAVVFAARDPLGTDDLARLAELAGLASPACRVALERERDRHRAEYDGLTGLLTPRAFRQRLAALVDRARRDRTMRLALVFVDTDHFKHWNDTFGHAAGDALLRELAVVLRGAAAPERDLVARNGGDEFCLVFAESDKATAIERAEALRTRIASLDVVPLQPAERDPRIRITASVGVAAFPADAETTSLLLERADAAMYHSKETGRDAVSYAGLDGAFVRLDRTPDAMTTSGGSPI
ncbi:MAG TPA: GGDEF domain-containing protein [Candidatus Elarobacter sp.]|nr:GGDEF domain-containing protein [Candidatus Elarobacter sp.]